VRSLELGRQSGFSQVVLEPSPIDRYSRFWLHFPLRLCAPKLAAASGDFCTAFKHALEPCIAILI